LQPFKQGILVQISQNKMKKRILQTSIKLNLIVLLLIGLSCQHDNATTKTDVATLLPDTVKIENKILTETQKLVGTWNFGHEPVAYDFNADGTFKEYSPKGALDPEAAEQVYTQGKWEIKDGQLILSQPDKTENIQLHWLKENTIFLGNLAHEYSEEYGTKEEFATEMGWTRAQ
jgi:hypothetical protein